MTPHLSRATIDGFDDLGREARAAAAEHASSCAECRERLLADEPARAFALLAAVPVPPERLARLGVRIDREIDRGAVRPAWPLGRVAASIAAAIVLAVLVGVVGLRGRTGRPNPGLGTPRAAAPVEPGWARVDLLSSPGEAQVLDLRVEDTQVVMIFDKDLDL